MGSDLHCKNIRGWAILTVWFLFAHGATAQNASEPSVLTHVKKIRSLTQTDAASSRPIRVRGVVTALSGWKNSFFLEESGTGISVDRTDHAEVHPGDEVEVTGTSGAGLFAPIILAEKVRVLGRGALPVARRVTYVDVAGGKQDSQLVEVHGIVHSAKVVESWGRRVLALEIDIGAGSIAARVHDFPEKDFSGLVDAEVKVRGVCGTNFNQRRQFVGVRLFVPDLKDIEVVATASPDPFAIPESGIENLLQFGSLGSSGHRVKISGIVTYQNRQHALFLQSGQNAIRVQSSDQTRLVIGSRAEAVGFVQEGEYVPELEDALVRELARGTPLNSLKITSAQVIQSKDGFTVAPYADLLVELQGEVVDTIERSDEQIWLLRDGAQDFSVDIPIDTVQNKPIDVRLGTRVRIRGICVVEVDSGGEPVSFHLLARSARDIFVISMPWWNSTYSFAVIAFLVLVCIALVIWILQLGDTLSPHRADSETLGHFAPGSDSLRITRIAALLAGGFALVVLLGGWAFGIPRLRQIFPGGADMMPNTAIALLALSTALYFEQLRKEGGGSRQLPLQLFSGLATLIGLLTLIEYLTGINLSIDGIFFAVIHTTTSVFPGRMAFGTAVSLTLLGYAIHFSHHRRGIVLRQSCVLFVGVIALLNIVGHLYGITNFYGLTSGIGMALHTSLAMITLCCGVLFAHPSQGLMANITSTEPGGVMARRLLPAALLIPILLGVLRWQGQLNGFYDTQVGLGLFTCANVLTFAMIVWINGDLLNRLGLQRSAAERRLRESEYQFRSTFEQAAVGIAHVKPDGTFLRVNEKLTQMVGFSREELLSRTFAEITHPDDLASDWEQLRALLNGEVATYSMDKRYVRKDGGLVWIRLTVSLVRKSDGMPHYLISVIEDITERKLAQIGLERSLAEKETMLREIHHRVKNNLQVIASLLRMQRTLLKNEEAREALNVSQRRVVTMALIHERLYGTQHLDRIDFAEYAKALLEELLHSYREGSERITGRLEASPVLLNIGQAIPCGLILNELVTNALKHAYPNGNRGEIVVQFGESTPGNVRLSVVDHGVGLPEGFDSKNSRSMGVPIVDSLVEQLEGQLTIVSKDGTTFTLEFPREVPAPKQNPARKQGAQNSSHTRQQGILYREWK